MAFEDLNKLNSLYPQSFGWSLTKARKEHIDLFGIKINAGQDYYSRSSNSWNTERLSMESFDKFIHILFENNPQLQELTEHISKLRFDRLRDVIGKIDL